MAIECVTDGFLWLLPSRRRSHMCYRSEWLMLTIQCWTSPDFDPMSFMVYSGVCSWFEIRTKDYWAQHTLNKKKNAFEINYFVLEQPKVLVFIYCVTLQKTINITSGWCVIKDKTFPCRNILMDVIGAYGNLKNNFFHVRESILTFESADRHLKIILTCNWKQNFSLRNI